MSSNTRYSHGRYSLYSTAHCTLHHVQCTWLQCIQCIQGCNWCEHLIKLDIDKPPIQFAPLRNYKIKLILHTTPLYDCFARYTVPSAQNTLYLLRAPSKLNVILYSKDHVFFWILVMKKWHKKPKVSFSVCWTQMFQRLVGSINIATTKKLPNLFTQYFQSRPASRS